MHLFNEFQTDPLPIISTQSSFKQQAEADFEAEEKDGQEAERSDRGIFDIVIESPRSSNEKGKCFIAIESKIESDFGSDQLKVYEAELKRKKDSFKKCFLVTLTKYPHPKDCEDRALSWGKVQQLLGRVEDSPIKIIYSQFAEFLKGNNMENVLIPKMDVSLRESFIQGLDARQNMEKILLRVMDRKEFKNNFRRAIVYNSDLKGKFLGIYSKKSKSYCYFGIELEPIFQLYAEGYAPKKSDRLRQLKNEFGEQNVRQWLDNESPDPGITISQPVEPDYNGNAEKIEEWLVRAVAKIVKFSEI